MKVIGGKLQIVCTDRQEAAMFVAAFVARARIEGWDVDGVEVTISVFADD